MNDRENDELAAIEESLSSVAKEKWRTMQKLLDTQAEHIRSLETQLRPYRLVLSVLVLAALAAYPISRAVQSVSTSNKASGNGQSNGAVSLHSAASVACRREQRDRIFQQWAQCVQIVLGTSTAASVPRIKAANQELELMTHCQGIAIESSCPSTKIYTEDAFGRVRP